MENYELIKDIKVDDEVKQVLIQDKMNQLIIQDDKNKLYYYSNTKLCLMVG